MAWTWREPLNDAMQQLQRYLGDAEKYLPVRSIVRTTDATVTTLFSANIPVNTTVIVEGYVAGRRTGGSGGAANDGAGYRVTFCAKNTSGTAALIGAGAVTVIGESQAGWDVTLDASGGTIRVRVTGAANNNITWAWTTKSLSVTE
jgi:hypothetical protein